MFATELLLSILMGVPMIDRRHEQRLARMQEANENGGGDEEEAEGGDGETSGERLTLMHMRSVPMPPPRREHREQIHFGPSPPPSLRQESSVQTSDPFSRYSRSPMVMRGGGGGGGDGYGYEVFTFGPDLPGGLGGMAPPPSYAQLRFPHIFGGPRMSNAFGSGRDFQSELESILMPSLILAALQQAEQREPPIPPLTNEEKKSLEYQLLSSDLVGHLAKHGCEECTVCQEGFHDIWMECVDYAARPSITSKEDMEEQERKAKEREEKRKEREAVREARRAAEGENEEEGDAETLEEEEPEKYHRRHDVSVCRLPCNHFFCKECILKWMAYTSTCPNCRLLLNNLADKYSGKEESPAKPIWWCGVKEPDCVEVLPDDEPKPADEPMVDSAASPLPIPMFVPRPPNVVASSPSSSGAVRNPRSRLRLESGPENPAPAAVEPLGSQILDTPPTSPEETLSSSARFAVPNVVSPHRVPVDSDEEISFEELPQGNGARAVRRLRRGRWDHASQSRVSSRRPPVPSITELTGPQRRQRVSAEGNQNSLFPRIQLSNRPPPGQRLRVVPLQQETSPSPASPSPNSTSQTTPSPSSPGRRTERRGKKTDRTDDRSSRG